MNPVNENGKQQSSSEKAVSAPLLVSALIVSLFFAVGSSMTSIRKIFTPTGEERKVLAKVFADYGHKIYVIFKVKTRDGIALEIFEKDVSHDQQNFKQRFILTDDSEAYLMVNNDSMNLGLVDVNKDGQMDIVAPTVDKNGNSRLNVYEYNKDLNQFLPYTEAE